MADHRTRTRGRDKKPRRNTGRGTRERKPTALKCAYARGAGRMSTERYPAEALTLFKARRSTGGQASSFRAIQGEIAAQFGRRPALSTLQQWAVRFDPEIRDLRRVVDEERTRCILEGERARLEALSSVLNEVMQWLPVVCANMKALILSGKVDVIALMELPIKICAEARKTRRGEGWAGQRSQPEDQCTSMSTETAKAFLEHMKQEYVRSKESADSGQ